MRLLKMVWPNCKADTKVNQNDKQIGNINPWAVIAFESGQKNE